MPGPTVGFACHFAVPAYGLIRYVMHPAWMRPDRYWLADHYSDDNWLLSPQSRNLCRWLNKPALVEVNTATQLNGQPDTLRAVTSVNQCAIAHAGIGVAAEIVGFDHVIDEPAVLQYES